MPTVISISQQSQQSPPAGSDSQSGSFTDETSSSGTGVHVSAHEDSDHLEEEGWEGISYSDEIEPSESASRPRPAPRYRSSSRPAQTRRAPARRHTTAERTIHHTAGHRLHSRRPAPEAPSSVDDYDQYPAYSRPYPPQAHQYGGRGGYPQSHVGAFPANPFQANPTAHAGQLTRFDSPGAYQQYPPGNPFSPTAAAPGAPNYFSHAHHPPGPVPPGFTGHELMAYGAHPPGYGFPSPYGLPPGMPPQYYQHFAPSPPPVEAAPAPAAPAATPTPDPAVEAKQKELEARIKILQLENEEAKKKEAEQIAAEKKAIADAELKKATDQRIQEEIAKAKKDMELQAMKDAEKAKADAEKAKADAEAKTKTEADIKAKVEAEMKAKAAEDAKKAEEKAAEDAKTNAAKAPPPPEKKKPIKFKDAVGRKFSFPFHLCQTWAGMEDLIKQAFLHVEVIGPHVADGHYDLVGPNGEIILPQVWETMIEPDWAITMHMWPMPERPKPAEDPDAPIIIEAGPGGPRGPPERRRRERINVGGPPPGGRMRGPAPPPPPHLAGGGLPSGIVMVDDPPPRKKKTESKSSGGFLGSFLVGGGKSSKSGGKKKK